MRTTKAALGISGLLLFTFIAAACASPGPTSQTPAVATVTATATVTVTAEPTSGNESTSGDTADSTPSGPQVIRVEPGDQRTLTKADAFKADNWDEGSYQAVGNAQATQALANSAWCNNTTDPLEFRFSQNQGTLKFTVAHSIDSASSNSRLEWALLVDGRQVQTKSIAFKQSAELNTSLTGVAVVQLQFRNTDCSGDKATGLVTSATIQG